MIRFKRLVISDSVYSKIPAERNPIRLKIAKTVQWGKPDIYSENYEPLKPKKSIPLEKKNLKISKSIYISDRPGYGDWHNYINKQISISKGYITSENS